MSRVIGTSRRLRQHLRGNDDGNVMLEFALILPVLCLMLVGMFDLGRFGLQKSAMSQGAREGAQYGILAPTDSAGINTTAQNATGLSGVTATNTLFYECTAGVSVPAGTVCGSGQALKTYLTVSVTKTFSSVLSSGKVSFGTFGTWTAPTSVSASVTMICP
jgi:Flp pilus assembly protein TadG